MKPITFMKKYGLWLSAAVILLVIAVVVMISSTGTSGAGKKSDGNGSLFADEHLEQLVRELTEMPFGKLAAEDLAQITVLKGRSLSIQSLDGIEHLKNLIELDLRDNQITDITPLQKLVQLKKINLRDNEITDISALSHLTMLEEINLRGNWIEDISALKELANLKDANLRYNRIRNVEALAELPNLTQRLYLEGNLIEDYAPLASNYKNIKDTDFTLKTALPLFSQQGGFYEASFELELSTSHENADIYYTLDGSEPTKNSLKYTGPITITKKDPSEAVISNIRTADNTYLGSYGGRRNPIDWRQPENVFMATVVRAKVFPHDGEPSDSVAHTYFVDEQMKDKYSLPIVSITTDAEHFFDYDRGIYVPGKKFGGDPRSSGNYKMKGDDWERPIHFEYFEQDGTRGYALNAGARIHGNASATLPQKSLRIMARDEYGQSWMHYPFFKDEPAKEYKRLVLRNSGNDWVETLFRDAFMQSLMKDMHIDIQLSQPVIVFINGEYWGIQNLRELNDRHAFYAKYGVDPDQIDLLEQDYYVKDGDWQTYDVMIQYIKDHDISNDEHYEKLLTMIDVDNYIDYLAGQIYIANHDWPHNNIRYWRAKNDYDPSAPYGHDGRWRYIVYDTDYGFALSGNALNNTLQHLLKSNEGPRMVAVGLFQNEQFQQQFINRFADLLNTSFASKHVLAQLEQTAAMYAPEMEKHIERWGFPTSMERWEQYVGNMRKFAEVRTDVVRNHINQHFKLDGLVNVTVQLPGEHGTIRINTIELDGDDENWEGVYFKNVPITLTAIPASGYEFAGWGDSLDSTQQVITVNLEEDVLLTPTFR